MNASRLKSKLLTKFELLRDVHIVSYSYEYSTLKERMGKVGSKLFEELIISCDNPRVGIGGGSTIHSIIDALSYKPRTLRIFPTALIGRGPEVSHIDSTFLATLLYLKSRPLSKAFIINVPPLPSNRTVALEFIPNLIKEVDEVRWLAKEMDDLDIAFIGLGALIPTGDFDDEMAKLGVSITTLKNKGVVGGINYNWFTSDGDQVVHDFLTVSVQTLKSLSRDKNKQIVLVAGGTHKVPALETALSYGMANTLITDSLSARSLLGLP